MEQADKTPGSPGGDAQSPGMANTAVAFVVALAAFGALFFLLDYAVMSAQGLTLLFHG